jgi:hypothetical protein
VLADIGTPPHEVCRDALHLLGHEQDYEQWLAEQPKDDLT